MTDLDKKDEELQLIDTDIKKKSILTWRQLIIYFLISLGIAVAVGIIIPVVLMVLGYNEAEIDLLFYDYNSNLSLIVDALIVISAIFAYKYVKKFVLESLDFSVLRKGKTYIYVLLSMILIFIIQYISVGLIGFESGGEAADSLGMNSNNKSILEYILIFLTVAVITPIKEEFLFRGIIHRFFATKYNFWLGLIISSVFFGLEHIEYPITAISMGIILVLSYRLTNSLVTPILINILWNLLVIISSLFA